VGSVTNVIVVGKYVWWTVRRTGGGTWIEVMDAEAFTDAAVIRYQASQLPDPVPPQVFSQNSPISNVIAPEALPGEVVDLLLNDQFVDSFTIPSNAVLPFVGTAGKAEVGYPFRCVIKPMPFDAGATEVVGTSKRIYLVTLRLRNTYGLLINGKRLNLPPASAGGLISGDYSQRLLGWSPDPRITVSQDGPHPFQVLGMTMEVSFN
jgi:hypothetical protein